MSMINTLKLTLITYTCHIQTGPKHTCSPAAGDTCKAQYRYHDPFPRIEVPVVRVQPSASQLAEPLKAKTLENKLKLQFASFIVAFKLTFYCIS